MKPLVVTDKIYVNAPNKKLIFYTSIKFWWKCKENKSLNYDYYTFANYSCFLLNSPDMTYHFLSGRF